MWNEFYKIVSANMALILVHYYINIKGFSVN